MISLGSYSIDPEIVPGRLGLLVTLYLILTNVYNSVEAPKSRGFSYIEVWLVGMQIPILVAICEYVILLATKKYGNHHTCSIQPKVVQVGLKSKQFDIESDFDNIAKKGDKWTFIASSFFIMIFTTIYCFVGHHVNKVDHPH